jgi:threonine/homoserine/homoserine lactone efflux protein
MIDLTTLLTYAAVVLGLFLIPGPAVLARSVTGGPRVGVATGFGIALGVRLAFQER